MRARHTGASRRLPFHPRHAIWAVAGFLALAGSALAEEAAPGAGSAPELPFAVEELASTEGGPSVWAALQPEARRFNDSNSLVVAHNQGVLVVDAQANPATVEALIGEIERRHGKPVTTLVTTHWHGDHTQGGWVYRQHFGDSLEIVGQTTQREDVVNRARPALKEEIGRYREALEAAEARLSLKLGAEGGFATEEEREAFRGRVERTRAYADRLQALEIPSPSLTFETGLVLHRGGREIHLLAMEGHSRGDVVVYLPAERILASGDLLDDLPFGGHGYPRPWLASLEALGELDFEILVPGHGRVRRGEDARRHLTLVTEMVRSILDQVTAAVAAGKSLEETREAVELARFRTALAGEDPLAQRVFDQFLPETVDRAYLEAKGDLPD